MSNEPAGRACNDGDVSEGPKFLTNCSKRPFGGGTERNPRLVCYGVRCTDTTPRSDEAAESDFHCQAAVAIKLQYLQRNSMINAVR